MVNVMCDLLGDYAQTASMDVFTASQFDRHSTELASLAGARLVTASETRRVAEGEVRIKIDRLIKFRLDSCDATSHL